MTTLYQIKLVVDRVYPEYKANSGFIDSLDVVEIVMAVEDQLNVQFDDYKLEKFQADTPLADIPEILYGALV
jgi:acyl carrier protein